MYHHDEMEKYNNIVFFDGVCSLCHYSVNYLIRIDKNRVLKYSSIQGEYLKNILSTQEIEQVDSVLYWSDGVLYSKAQAAIKILLKMNGIYKYTGYALNIFPVFVLNLFYKIIARNRYSLFGKEESCRIPSYKEKQLFID